MIIDIQELKTLDVDQPIIVTWVDAYDAVGELELTGESLDIPTVTYDTIGFFIGYTKEYLTVGYNKEIGTNTYRNYGSTPISCIKLIKTLGD
jgi:hypothetical protein